MTDSTRLHAYGLCLGRTILPNCLHYWLDQETVEEVPFEKAAVEMLEFQQQIQALVRSICEGAPASYPP